MKITDVRTSLLAGPAPTIHFCENTKKSTQRGVDRDMLTDGSHTGIGETYAGYFCWRNWFPSIVEFFKPILIRPDGRRYS